MYALFYYCAFKYPSQLSKALKAGDWGYFFYVIGTHIGAIYFFLTTGDDPGWADEHQDDCRPSDDIDASSPLTITINDKKQIVMMPKESSANRLKLSSEEEDSSGEEVMELSKEAGALSSPTGQVEKRTRAKRTKSAKNRDVEMNDLEKDPIYQKIKA